MSPLLDKHQCNLAHAKAHNATTVNMPLYEYANLIGYLETYEKKIEGQLSKEELQRRKIVPYGRRLLRP